MMTFQIMRTRFPYFIKRILTAVPAIVIALFLMQGQTHAQQEKATAEVDTSAILIGGQVTLSLHVNHPSNIKVEWPLVPDTFALFEKVKDTPIDTVINANDKTITRNQHFKITSFDSGFHVIPPFEFLYRLPGDTAFQKAETEPILITVNTIPVDTTRAFKDLKGQVVIPFSWMDLLPWFIAVIIIVLVVFLVYRLIKKFREEKKPIIVKEPWRPADEIALEALQKLEAAKLWQQGNYKSYYTGLADITRTFIENRWSVNAMEMTTDEIVRMSIISSQAPEIYRQLKNLLELADLVKFAKVIPVLHENEQSMRYAVDFVKANKKVIETKEVTA